MKNHKNKKGIICLNFPDFSENFAKLEKKKLKIFHHIVTLILVW